MSYFPWADYAQNGKISESSECRTGREGEKMGRQNLQYQLLSSIDSCFCEGTKKRTMKKEFGRDMDFHVYSYEAKNDLCDKAKDFAKYMKIQYPQVKYVRDLTSQHIFDFVEYVKARNEEEGHPIKKSTFEQYKNRFKKIELILNHTYKTCSLDFKTEKIESDGLDSVKLRDVWMDEKDLDMALEYKEKFGRPCNGLVGLKICVILGTRSEEVSNIRGCDIDLEKRLVRVKGKHGKVRYIPFGRQWCEFFQTLKQGKGEEQKVCPIRGDSINKYLHEGLKACGVDDKYTKCKTGIHAIRKMVAQREYDSCRNRGMSKEEALKYVNVYLGHGESRTSLNTTYLHNIW